MVKNTKIKQSKLESDDVVKVRNLFILLVAVVIICVGLFYLTEKMIDSDIKKTESKEEVEIDYDIATIGTMFNRIEDTYYVLMYSNKDNGNDLNSSLDSYRSSDDYIKTYYIDLDLKINEIALGDKFVAEPKNSNEVKVKEATLFMINNGKVTKTITGVNSIKEIIK